MGISAGYACSSAGDLDKWEQFACVVMGLHEWDHKFVGAPHA
jgi:hypothetical protein